MLKDKIEKALNEQINEELFSAYLYLSMSAYFASKNYPGFANWMYIQYQEESTHAMKLYHFILQRGGQVNLKTVTAPTREWSSHTHVFQETLKHEEHITARINALADIAIAEKDHATHMFLQWFINEQVEEEANASQLLEQLKMIHDSREGLYMLDKELAARVFIDPTAATTP